MSRRFVKLQAHKVFIATGKGTSWVNGSDGMDVVQGELSGWAGIITSPLLIKKPLQSPVTGNLISKADKNQQLPRIILDDKQNAIKLCIYTS